MSIITTGNMSLLLEQGLYAPKQKKKSSVKTKPITVKKVTTKNKGK